MSAFTKRDAAMAGAWLTAGAIGATVLTGIAFAADDTTTPPTTAPGTSAPSTTAPDDSAAGERPGGHGRGGPGRGMGGGPGGGLGFGLGPGLGRVLHGDVTVTDKDGATSVVRAQRGEITAVSSTSVTIKSSDGYTSTWTINADTTITRDREDKAATDLKVGDTVSATGPLSGDTATAKRLHALSPEAAAKVEEERAAREAEREQNQQEQSTEAPSTQGSNSSSSASFSA
jgi:hypothetical protein